MKDVFCYYRKSMNFRNSWSPVQRIVHQDKVLHRYCRANDLTITKRYSDLGYLGSPYRRPELLEMIKIIEKPKLRADSLLFYSIAGLRTDMKANADLLLEVVKVLEQVHFYREKLTLDYEKFEMYMKGAASSDIYNQSQVFIPSMDHKEEA